MGDLAGGAHAGRRGRRGRRPEALAGGMIGWATSESPWVHITDPDEFDLAAIFHTSGTTGFPKGAMTTHENILSKVETCLRRPAVDREDSASTLMPVRCSTSPAATPSSSS